MAKFKIFYSWQSDLPENKTRNFIRECIDKAIDLASESEAIEAERDEATSGLTGSPDIVASLFSKIDDCDLFVADLSLCFKEMEKEIKKSPNPNVLLELGYAVKTLSWDRVICLCNTDFGEDYPFDVEHNRITRFSLKDCGNAQSKSRNEIKGEIAEIIFKNIRDLRSQPPRAKSGMAAHVVGFYDCKDRTVINKLIPINLRHREGYLLHNKELIFEAKNLVAQIIELTKKIETVPATEIEDKSAKSESAEVDGVLNKVAVDPADTVGTDKTISPLNKEMISLLASSYKGSETPVIWDDVDGYSSLIKHWLDFEVPSDFFNLGGLTQRKQLFNDATIVGTDEEKEKYDLLNKLTYNLSKLEIRDKYLNTYDELYYFPLAIWNVSSIKDEDISILVTVKSGKCVNPDEHFIWPEFEGMQGLICKDEDDESDVGVVTELFAPEEDGSIHLETPRYAPSEYNPKIPLITDRGITYPEKTSKDYEEELQMWIAKPIGDGYYEFDVVSLRPNECKWLSYGMMIRPDNGMVKVQYKIKSAHSTGDIEGELEFNEDMFMSF